MTAPACHDVIYISDSDEDEAQCDTDDESMQGNILYWTYVAIK